MNKNVRCLWRVSPSNLGHVNKFPEMMRHQFQEDSGAVVWADKVCQNMQKSFNENRLFFESKDNDETVSLSESENLFKGRVYAIVNSKCFSACLDFLDLLKISKIPFVMIGQTTGADSSYMEVREVKLPSEIGLFRFPIKVYINRMRGHNQPYKPDVDCSAFIKDTQKLESVVLSHLGDKEINLER